VGSDANSFVISVRAKPRSPVSSLETDASGNWIARLRSSPVDGKANAELISLISKHFACPKSSVVVISGASARLKLVRVSGAAANQPGGTRATRRALR
jgi:uncharacterized protein YggU (UPF0235/DUF167 family)